MENILSVFLGLGLASAAGFRIFVPLLITNIASLLGLYQFDGGMEWMGTWTALAILLSATLAEIAAYYVPWLDHLLDTIALPASIMAGTILATSFVNIDDPTLKWALGLIVGGGAAGIVQAGTSLLRLGSTATTGGLANPIVATSENIFAIILSILSLILPILMAVCAFIFLVYIARKILNRKVDKTIQKL
ncbi:MAG: DUF4126 domain-containing protein [Bacteroidota bacterium]